MIMLSDLPPETLLTAAAEIILPMAGMQLIYRLADRRGRLAKKLLPTKARRGVMLTAGILLTVLITGAAAFVTKAGIGIYYIVCGAVVGLITGVVLASMSGGQDE